MTDKSKYCLVCCRPRPTLYFHIDEDTKEIWCYCTGKCQRGYGIRQYCHLAGVDLKDFLQGDFDFDSAPSNEIRRIEWPDYYVSMSDSRANKGVNYIKSRGLDVKGDLYYDMESNGIVLPYYFHSVFAGAQIRLIEPWTNKDGEVTKMLTMPGTRLGLLIYGWNQLAFMTNIKSVVVCEGAINTLSLQQALDKMYGGVLNNPFKVIATSGCGTSEHQIDKLKELKEAGKKIICAFDSDQPGLEGLSKMKQNDCITHFSLTQDTDLDWNDILKEQGHEALAKQFLENVTKLD